MSGVKGQLRIDHQHAAQQARQMPGQWVLAGTYNGSGSAASAASQVRTAGLPAYRPPRSFEARTDVTQDGVDLWVRHVADPSASGFRDSIKTGLTESFEAFSRRLDEATTTSRSA